MRDLEATLEFTWGMFDIPHHSRAQLREESYRQLNAVASSQRLDESEYNTVLIFISSDVAVKHLDEEQAKFPYDLTGKRKQALSTSSWSTEIPAAGPPRSSLVEEKFCHAETASDMVRGWRQGIAEAATEVYAPSTVATSVTACDDSDCDSESEQSQNLGKTDAATCTTSDPELNSELDGHIEYDLTIQVPHDMIEDDHALALVQVVPPDADLSDIPESWNVYDIDLTGDLPDEEEKWEQSESDCYWEEDPPNDILDEPDEGSYYSEDPGEDQEYDR